jgi:hypothetical protein
MDIHEHFQALNQYVLEAMKALGIEVFLEFDFELKAIASLIRQYEELKSCKDKTINQNLVGD